MCMVKLQVKNSINEVRKRKPNGNIRLAELHWYEAHGIGKRKIKIKKLLD